MGDSVARAPNAVRTSGGGANQSAVMAVRHEVAAEGCLQRVRHGWKCSGEQMAYGIRKRYEMHASEA